MRVKLVLGSLLQWRQSSALEKLLPLNRGGRLTGNIVGDAGNTGDLVDNAVRYGLHEFIG